MPAVKEWIPRSSPNYAESLLRSDLLPIWHIHGSLLTWGDCSQCGTRVALIMVNGSQYVLEPAAIQWKNHRCNNE